MSEILVKIKTTRENEDLLPTYMTQGSAGADVKSAEETVILPGKRALIGTGLFLEVPLGYEVQIRPRSGLAAKHGVIIPNSPGTLDSDYRGELRIILLNLGEEAFVVKRGDRIAQIVVAKVHRAEFAKHEELSETSRGHGGFGSTGV